MLRFVALIALGLLLQEETYDIKFKESSRVKRLRNERVSSQKTTLKLLDAQGKALQDKVADRVETFHYEETIVEMPDPSKRATKLRRHYDKAQVRIGDKASTFPYQGKTVLIEKKDGKYVFQVEGGEALTGDDAAPLDKEFNKQSNDDSFDFEKHILPKKPVRVGEVWDIEVAPLIKDLEKTAPVRVDPAKALARGKLLRAYRKDGNQFGVLEVQLELPVTSLEMGTQKVTLAAGSLVKATMQADQAIDGSTASVVGRMIMSMKVESELSDPLGNKIKLIMGGDWKEDQTRTELPAK